MAPGLHLVELAVIRTNPDEMVLTWDLYGHRCGHPLIPAREQPDTRLAALSYLVLHNLFVVPAAGTR